MESDNFSEIRGDLKQGEMQHCLWEDGRPCQESIVFNLKWTSKVFNLLYERLVNPPESKSLYTLNNIKIDYKHAYWVPHSRPNG